MIDRNPVLLMLNEKKLAGLHLPMSLAKNRTGALWKSFMPRRGEIKNSVGNLFYSLQEYSAGYFANFKVETEFRKWAAVEVTDFEAVPEGMKTMTLPGGMYAVFLFTGAASGAAEAFQYIFSSWLPASEFVLDDRPHFEILQETYDPEDALASEEIWIPIRTSRR